MWSKFRILKDKVIPLRILGSLRYDWDLALGGPNNKHENYKSVLIFVRSIVYFCFYRKTVYKNYSQKFYDTKRSRFIDFGQIYYNYLFFNVSPALSIGTRKKTMYRVCPQ